mgnify:CR=1 FL=1
MLKAYLTTIGERTTDICKWQLERLGFEVVLLDKVEPWGEKYRRFIRLANENCLRVDADVIVNKNILECKNLPDDVMAQFTCFDFYRNDVWNTCPVYYGKEISEIIKSNLDKIGNNRPETEAWRLPQVQPLTLILDKKCYGMHGFFQDDATHGRAYQNRKDRGQLEQFDFELVERLKKL